MGVVYRAVDLRLERVVALKLITPALSADEDFRRRFKRESQLAASVRQQNVVTIYQAGEAEGLLFVTMELVQGKDLRAVLTERERLDLVTATAIVTQLAAALDAAHASGLVHRDVKPGNVLIGAASPLHVYLTDFGLTKRTSSQSGITKTGLFVGTIDYAAPEQIKGWPVDARADVYAIGCVLFEMVAGQPPFKRENEYATMYAHTSEPPPTLTSLAPGAPPALDAVIARALAKEPDDRFPSAGDFARAVSAATVGQAPAEPERTVAVGRAAPPPPPPTIADPHPVYGYGLEPAQVSPAALPSPTQPRRNPWIAVLAVIAVLLVGGGVAAAVLLSGGDEPSAQPQPQPQPNPNPNPVPQPNGPSVRDGVVQIAGVLDLSRKGRHFIRDRNFSGAIENRRQVITRLDRLTLVSELEPSRRLLRQAMLASIDADLALIRCETCGSTIQANERATALKDDFTIEFNPFALRYLGHDFDPDRL
jgi:serine/threonine protein kinase